MGDGGSCAAGCGSAGGFSAGGGSCEAGGGIAGDIRAEGGASEEGRGPVEDAGGARLTIGGVSNDGGLSEEERAHLI